MATTVRATRKITTLYNRVSFLAGFSALPAHASGGFPSSSADGIVAERLCHGDRPGSLRVLDTGIKAAGALFASMPLRLTYFSRSVARIVKRYARTVKLPRLSSGCTRVPSNFRA